MSSPFGESVEMRYRKLSILRMQLQHKVWMETERNLGQGMIKTLSGEPQPLVIIIGPTAVGKTKISIQLAERLEAEIISADSRLFYRGLDIGTAKPSLEDIDRVPHHLIDVTDPDQVWSVVDFKQMARNVIADIHSRGKIPFLVGGTGQYIRAVIEEWEIPQVEPDERLRTALENWADTITATGLHQRLAVIDHVASERIEPRNLRRTVRALEVIFKTGERFSKQRRKGDSPYNTLILGLKRPRDELFARIDKRIQNMLADGLIDEVRWLMLQGYSPDLPTLSAIGYQEIIYYLRGRITLEESVRLIQRRTRVFVRRQSNWFKRDDPDILWFDVGSESIEVMESAIRQWLMSNWFIRSG
jgi:tRNA dimethylallyltransferase